MVSFDHPIAYAIDAYKPLVGAINEADGNPGETYVRIKSTEVDNEWFDVATQSTSRSAPGSACIKVLTIDRELTKTETISIYLDKHPLIKIGCYALPIFIIILVALVITRKARRKEMP